MERLSYKKVKEYIKGWNENHPECQFVISCYSDYYHIQYADTHNNIIVEKTPGRLWESFCIFKEGYFKALELNK